MPWKCAGKVIKPGKEFIDASGSLHGKLWMRHSAEDKKRFGITWEDPPASEAPFDNRFYWGRQTDGTLIPKSLADVNEVDTNGNAIKDAVRTKCAEIETALNNASDLAAFMKLFDDERNLDGTLKTIAKINDWPEEI